LSTFVSEHMHTIYTYQSFPSYFEITSALSPMDVLHFYASTLYATPSLP
jgi:hypothetical protein